MKLFHKEPLSAEKPDNPFWRHAFTKLELRIGRTKGRDQMLGTEAICKLTYHMTALKIRIVK